MFSQTRKSRCDEYFDSPTRRAVAKWYSCTSYRDSVTRGVSPGSGCCHDTLAGPFQAGVRWNSGWRHKRCTRATWARDASTGLFLIFQWRRHCSGLYTSRRARGAWRSVGDLVATCSTTLYTPRYPKPFLKCVCQARLVIDTHRKWCRKEKCIAHPGFQINFVIYGDFYTLFIAPFMGVKGSEAWYEMLLVTKCNFFKVKLINVITMK